MSAIDITAVRRYVAAARRAKGAPNRIKGGKADGVHPRYFSERSLVQGTIHELEHTRSIALAMEIAMDHLFEDASYYAKLERMERSGKQSKKTSKRRSLAHFLRPQSRAWGDR